MRSYHVPVLLQEVLDNLRVRKGTLFIDATIGGGGHALEMVKSGARVLGIDVDEDAIAYVSQEIENEESKEFKDRIVLVRANFNNLKEIAKRHGFDEVDGVLFDLGVSSHQLDTPRRGFSFKNEALLDMRMDQTLGVKAVDLINILNKKQLYELFSQLGQEHNAWIIADRIVRARRLKRIETTVELADLIRACYKKRSRGIDPATKVFQALRIIINDELTSLKLVLPDALEVLKNGGRIGVLSFHSLEDRIVKETFLDFEKEKKGTIITKTPIVPTDSEVQRNVRSRSAKLRIFKKKTL